MKVSLVLLAGLSVVLARPQAPSSEYGPPGGGYPKGGPSGDGLGASKDMAPSSEYGPPGGGYPKGGPSGDGLGASKDMAPSSEYGPPGGGYPKGGPSGDALGASKDENADMVDKKSADNATVTDNETVKGTGNDDSTTEQIIELTTVSEAPANYNFEYEVKDAESGNDFGHKESRMGHVAMGSYHVLLSDGRIQKVDYVADQDGYRPTVTYTGEAKFGAGVGGGKVGSGASAPGASYGPPGGGYYKRR